MVYSVCIYLMCWFRLLITLPSLLLCNLAFYSFRFYFYSYLVLSLFIADLLYSPVIINPATIELKCRKVLSYHLQGGSGFAWTDCCHDYSFIAFLSLTFVYILITPTLFSCFCPGARVILACRDMTRAHIAADEIRQQSGNGNVVVKKLDLSSLQSVRDLAKDVEANEDRLDILINNAGTLQW